MIALEKQGFWYIILVSKYSLDNNSTIMAVDENGEYRPIWCSGEYAEMMEGEAEECIRYEASEENVSVHPEDKDEVAYLFNNQKTRDGKNSLTIRKLTLKGNEIWVNVHFAFVKDEGDTVCILQLYGCEDDPDHCYDSQRL